MCAVHLKVSFRCSVLRSMRATIRSVSVNLDTAYSAFVTPGRMDRGQPSQTLSFASSLD